MRYLKTSLILGLLALQFTASAAEVSSSVPTVQIPFEKYTLANGLQVLLAEDKRLPMVAANLRFQVGSANDPPERTGFAHLFEHLYAFSGPDDFPSLQSVRRAAQRYLDPKHMLIVAVGDRAVIESELRKLDLGAVSVE